MPEDSPSLFRSQAVLSLVVQTCSSSWDGRPEVRGPQGRGQSRQLNEALSQNMGEKGPNKHLPCVYETLDPNLNTRTKKQAPQFPTIPF